jgi:hypothetical protein
LQLNTPYCIQVSAETKDADNNTINLEIQGLKSTVSTDTFQKTSTCSAGKTGAAYKVTLTKTTGNRTISVVIKNQDTITLKQVTGVLKPNVSNYTKTINRDVNINEQLTVTAHPTNVAYTCKNLTATLKLSPTGKLTGTLHNSGTHKATCTSKNTTGQGNSFNITINVKHGLPVLKQNKYKFKVNDINKNIHAQGIKYSYTHSITKGCSWNKTGNNITTSYCPNKSVNRGAMAELMYNLMNKPAITKPIPKINDISKLSKTRQQAIKWLASENITVLSNNKYNPNNTINRGAMAELLYKLVGSPLYTPTKQDLTKFKDISNLSTSRQLAIAWLAKTGITTGTTKTTYAPRNAVNRGSMATFFMRIAKKFGGK